MSEFYEIRAQFDADTITIYQAYNKEIAVLATQNNKFVDPFSFNRMTWVKPSFLWMMERSNWGQKPNQEHTLAIKIKRSSFEKALSLAVLTSSKKEVYKDTNEWEKLKKHALVNVQWDPERNLRGGKLNYRSIQIGISRHLIREYNEEWIVKIEDISPLVSKINRLKKDGNYEKAKLFLPNEKVYNVPLEIKRKLGMM